ncbi:MAG: site-specific integrase [Deltaproteobacteria bacterium]|nr:MAG: site-specific integrase [Deltaproteobacteria bacterium]
MKRPNSSKYRNLYVPADRTTIWYARVDGGRRIRQNTKSSPDTLDGWKEAALFRDKYEERKGIGRVRIDYGRVPTFADLVPRYFESQKFGQLAVTTQYDHRSQLADDGPVVPMLGRYRIDEITVDVLVEWWEKQARERAWTVTTGERYLTAIAQVLKVGRRYLDGRALPTVEARERIGEQKRTAAGRAVASAERRPIRDPEAIDALLASARDRGAEVYAFVLTLLDAGLRKGEARALRWRAIAWGADAEDTRRHVLVRGSRSRGADEDGHTKSGRSRTVALSRRLRGALEDLYLEQRPTTLDALTFPSLDESELRRTWPMLLSAASLPGLMWKDLRDTYGSWLLTLGIPIQYVSRQLGHSSIGITEKHYAEYLGRGGDGSQYVEPPKLERGEVPADLLARVGDCSQDAHTVDPYTLPDSLQASESASEFSDAVVQKISCSSVRNTAEWAKSMNSASSS